MNITSLGEPRFTSPVRRSIDEFLRVPENIIKNPKITDDPGLLFELAGPRSKLFFNPKETRAGIVTCGGLYPGLNDVIRSVFLVVMERNVAVMNWSRTVITV